MQNHTFMQAVTVCQTGRVHWHGNILSVGTLQLLKHSPWTLCQQNQKPKCTKPDPLMSLKTKMKNSCLSPGYSIKSSIKSRRRRKSGSFLKQSLLPAQNEYQCKTWCQTAQWWLSSQLPSKALAALQHTFAHRCNHQFFLSTTISRCFWSNTSWRLTSLTVSTSEALSFLCKWRVQ